MKRRTVILAIEIEGDRPDAQWLSFNLIGREAGPSAHVTGVQILDDGIGPDDDVDRRQARLTGKRP